MGEGRRRSEWVRLECIDICRKDDPRNEWKVSSVLHIRMREPDVVDEELLRQCEKRYLSREVELEGVDADVGREGAVVDGSDHGV